MSPLFFGRRGDLPLKVSSHIGRSIPRSPPFQSHSATLYGYFVCETLQIYPFSCKRQKNSLGPEVFIPIRSTRAGRGVAGSVRRTGYFTVTGFLRLSRGRKGHNGGLLTVSLPGYLFESHCFASFDAGGKTCFQWRVLWRGNGSQGHGKALLSLSLPRVNKKSATSFL